MKLGLKSSELAVIKEEPNINETDFTKNTELTRNNDQSSTKEDDNNTIFDEVIEYCSSPKIGLVSIHASRNKNNRYIKFTEDKTDIPNTVSMYIRQIKSELDKEENINGKIDVNFFNKIQSMHIKPEKKKEKEKKSIMINSYSTIKNIKSEKNNLLNSKQGKRNEGKKRMTKKLEKVKSVKKWESIEKPKDNKMSKSKSTSNSISFLSEKLTKVKNTNFNKHQEMKEKFKEDINKTPEDNSLSKSKSKSKTKIENEDKDMTPNIIIYGSESSSDYNDLSKNEEKKEEDFLKNKNYSNISYGNKKEDKSEMKIIKPKTKASTNFINKIKLKQKDNNKNNNNNHRMGRKYPSSSINHKIKLNSKYSSANEKEKNTDKGKDKKRFSLLKLITSNNLFKEDKEPNNKFKHPNSVSKNILSIKQYKDMSLKKNSTLIYKDMKDKDNKSMIKPNSDISLAKVDEYKKKSNKNLRHNELDKGLIKKHSYNSNMHIPRITINTRTQENDTNDIHLVVKGKEETIINYTNQQMIKDEKEYMIDCLKVLAKLKKEGMPRCKQKVNFNFPPEEKQKKIALFDLDETLVHCKNNEPGMDGDEVSIKLPTNKIVKVGLNIRKNWKNALDLIKNHYHVVIYTASHPSYADAVLDYLDKENKYFKYRLYRSHCIQCDVDGFKFYVKDLDTLDKYYNLKDIVIIDNSILSFAYHLYNGIPIVPFINQQNDTELMFTAHYLVSIANYDDLSLENKKHLNLDNLLSMAKILNEIEDNEEEEEEEDEEKTELITLNTTKKPKDETKVETIKETNINNKEPDIEVENGGNEINNINNGNKEENQENKKYKGRASIKKIRKTVKIAENMKKNIDEMLKKKKEELEKIDED